METPFFQDKFDEFSIFFWQELEYMIDIHTFPIFKQIVGFEPVDVERFDHRHGVDEAKELIKVDRT